MFLKMRIIYPRDHRALILARKMFAASINEASSILQRDVVEIRASNERTPLSHLHSAWSTSWKTHDRQISDTGSDSSDKFLYDACFLADPGYSSILRKFISRILGSPRWKRRESRECDCPLAHPMLACKIYMSRVSLCHLQHGPIESEESDPVVVDIVSMFFSL